MGVCRGGGGLRGFGRTLLFQLERRNLCIHPTRERSRVEEIFVFTQLTNEAERLQCIRDKQKYVGGVDCCLFMIYDHFVTDETPYAVPYKPSS